MLNRIAARIFNRPLLIHPAKAEIIIAALSDRLDLDGLDGLDTEVEQRLEKILRQQRSHSPAANRLVGEPGQMGGRRPMYRLTQGGVAIVPIVGTLVNRGAFVGDDGSGAVSYEGLSVQIAAALGDHRVQGILLDIDSPGGEANGMAALADMIRTASESRPIWAFVNDIAASAAYGIAAQATEIIISETSVVGSIGVFMVHMDVSREMEKRGRKITLISAGAHKVDGNPFEPLSDSVMADLKHEVDLYYDAFVKSVGAGRPSLGEAGARATEARISIGAEALQNGLADRIGSFPEAISQLAMARLNRTGVRKIMAHDGVNTFSQADLDRARSEGVAEGHAEGVLAGAKAAIDRARAILTCEAAAHRMPQAIKLALGTVPEAEAIDLLASFPEIKPEATPMRAPPVAERSQAPLPGAASNGPVSTREDIAAHWSKIHKQMGISLR